MVEEDVDVVRVTVVLPGAAISFCRCCFNFVAKKLKLTTFISSKAHP